MSEEERKEYKSAVKGLTEALCPTANREVYYREFESRLLRPGEDPAVYKWELEQALEKADPSLDKPAKVLLTRQFMKGLPNNKSALTPPTHLVSQCNRTNCRN